MSVPASLRFFLSQQAGCVGLPHGEEAGAGRRYRVDGKRGRQRRTLGLSVFFVGGCLCVTYVVYNLQLDIISGKGKGRGKEFWNDSKEESCTRPLTIGCRANAADTVNASRRRCIGDRWTVPVGRGHNS